MSQPKIEGKEREGEVSLRRQRRGDRGGIFLGADSHQKCQENISIPPRQSGRKKSCQL